MRIANADAESSGARARALTLPRQGSRQPLTVVVTSQGTARIVLLTDPERVQGPSGALLRRLYRLTPAEARLAARIGQGEALADAAAALGISVGTARIHLKRIFGKTGTSRQAQLVQLIWGSAAGLGRLIPADDQVDARIDTRPTASSAGPAGPIGVGR
jgi:DNA-binding CsgD family transcriptional regulator